MLLDVGADPELIVVIRNRMRLQDDDPGCDLKRAAQHPEKKSVCQRMRPVMSVGGGTCGVIVVVIMS